MKKYYFGGYPNESNNGIYALNEDFSECQRVVEAQYTTYFDVQDYIYTIIGENGLGGVAVYDLWGHCLAKTLTSLKPACYLEKRGSLIYTTHYHEGICRIYEWNHQQLSLKKQLFLGKEAKCHQVIFDPCSSLFGIVCLGLDQIIFFDEQFQEVSSIDFPKGSGPRHALYSHLGHYLHIISELSQQLFVYDTKQKEMVQVIDCTPTKKEGSGAAIRLSEDEVHLYTSVRYHDVIAHYIWEKDHWQPLQYYACKEVCRDFILSDQFLIATYQEGNCVEKIALDEHQNLAQVEAVFPLKKIVCVKQGN